MLYLLHICLLMFSLDSERERECTLYPSNKWLFDMDVKHVSVFAGGGGEGGLRQLLMDIG